MHPFKKYKWFTKVYAFLSSTVNDDLPEDATTSKDSKEKKLPELTAEMKSIHQHYFKSPWYISVADIDDIHVGGKDINTLYGFQHVNDTIIDFYLQAIVRRSAQNKQWPKCCALNSFFCQNLRKFGYKSIRKWTKNLDIFSFDKIFIPVHFLIPTHWCLATIDLKTQTISMYDSLGKDRDDILKLFPNFLESEHLDKRKSSFDASAFKLVNVKDIPLQENGWDCGMFVLKYAEYLSRNAKLTFTQQDIPYFRKRMVYEIVNNVVIHP